MLLSMVLRWPCYHTPPQRPAARGPWHAGCSLAALEEAFAAAKLGQLCTHDELTKLWQQLHITCTSWWQGCLAATLGQAFANRYERPKCCGWELVKAARLCMLANAMYASR